MMSLLVAWILRVLIKHNNIIEVQKVRIPIQIFMFTGIIDIIIPFIICLTIFGWGE